MAKSGESLDLSSLQIIEKDGALFYKDPQAPESDYNPLVFGSDLLVTAIKSPTSNRVLSLTLEPRGAESEGHLVREHALPEHLDVDAGSAAQEAGAQGDAHVQDLHGRRRGRGVPSLRPPHLLRAVRARAQGLPALQEAHPRNRQDVHVLITVSLIA